MRATTIAALVSTLVLAGAVVLHVSGRAPWLDAPTDPGKGPDGGARSGSPAAAPGPAGDGTVKAPPDGGGAEAYEPAGLPPENPWHETRGIGRRSRPPKGVIVFPDGTWWPPINRILDPPPFQGFGRDYPYAPIVKVKVDDRGLTWFEHADGSTSTVQDIELTDGTGRRWHEPQWVVGNPADLKPVRGPDGRIRYEKRVVETPSIRTGADAEKDGK